MDILNLTGALFPALANAADRRRKHEAGRNAEKFGSILATSCYATC
jgi:hypothetical protein